jgi:hypothetical protein
LVSSTNARRPPFAGGGEDFRRVALDADLAPFAPDPARAVDQERAALDAHDLAAVHVLLLPDPEQRCDRVIDVRAKLERKLHLVPELPVRLERVGRDAEDARARPREGGGEVAEIGAFQRAAGRVVARIEVDDETVPALAAQAKLAACGRYRELRRLFRRLRTRHRRAAS